MTGTPAASATCSPGITYGVSVGASAVNFLNTDPDGSRTCLQLWNDPASPGTVCIAMAQGQIPVATLTPIPNCVKLLPGQPYIVFNLPTGNGAFIVPNYNLSAISVSGTNNLVFSYCR